MASPVTYTTGMLTFPEIDPVALAIGPVKIHWYGLMYLLGFAAFWFLARLRAKKPWSPIRPEQVDDMLFYGAVGVILGGRIGYILFYQLPAFSGDPAMLLRIWEGGMSFHGGMLGVFIGMLLFARRSKIEFFRLTDFGDPMVPIGLGAGRFGNFINGELWGRVTDHPIGMVFPSGGPLPRHPSQLYEFALEGVAMFVILWLISAQPRHKGFVSGWFMILYGSFRFIVEFAREPDAHLGLIAFNWLSMGQLLSLPMVLVGVYLLYWSRSQPLPAQEKA